MDSTDARRDGVTRTDRGPAPSSVRSFVTGLARRPGLPAAGCAAAAVILLVLSDSHRDAAMHLVLAGLLVLLVVPLVLAGRLAAAEREQLLRDPLTGAWNRAGLQQATAELLAAATNDPRSLTAVAVVKFDDLRELRLTLGTDNADSLLAEAARRLADVPDSTVARIDSDALAVVIADRCTDDTPAEDIAAGIGEALRYLLLQPAAVGRGGLLVRPETSIGVAWSGEHGSGLLALPELLAAADLAAVGAATSSGRVALAERSSRVLDRDALALQAELPAAIENGELRVFFQPLLDAHLGRLVGAEALVRWEHPQRGLLGPGVFVPLAERSQAIIGLTYWVLTAAVEQCAAWHAEGSPIGVSVNLSAAMLAEDDLVETVEDLLLAHDLPPSTLTLEVTESALVHDPRRAREVLRALRAAGTRVSIDDFGTGYTSLTLLRQLQVDELKIDRTFVAAAADTPADAAIIRALVDLAHRMSMEVVAEGVEDARTSDLVTHLGVDVLQGFYFARPVPVEAFPGLSSGMPAAAAAAVPVADPTVVPTARDEPARLAATLRLAESVGDSRAFLEKVCGLAAALSGRELAVVTRVEADVVRELASFPHRDDSLVCSREESICSWVAGSGQLIDVADLETDPRHVIAVVGEQRIRAATCAPVRDAQGHVVAVLGVYGDRPGSLSASQRLQLAGLADLLAEHLAGADAARVLRLLHGALHELPHLDGLDTRTTRVDSARRLTRLCASLLGADAAAVLAAPVPAADVVAGTPADDADDLAWSLVTATDGSGGSGGSDRVWAAMAAAGPDLLAGIRATGRPLWIPAVETSPFVEPTLAGLLGDASLLLLPVGRRDGGVPWVLAVRWSPLLPVLPPALRDAAQGLCDRVGRFLASLATPASTTPGPAPVPALGPALPTVAVATAALVVAGTSGSLRSASASGPAPARDTTDGVVA